MLIQADARAIPLRDKTVQCVVTSPPYFGQRDYGIKEQIGLEQTPDAYVAQIVAVFTEVWRVLKDDGVVWLNLGDSYNNCDKWGGGGPNTGKHVTTKSGEVPSWTAGMEGVKPKDLIGIPWMVAFALRSDGWYLRSDVTWAKPNPMPESVTDRPTKSHEYLFLLTKSERYLYDAASIREPYADSTLREIEAGYGGQSVKDYAAAGVQDPSDTKRRVIESIRRRVTAGAARRESQGDRSRTTPVGRSCGVGLNGGRNKRSVWTVNTMPYAGSHFATMPEALVEPCIFAGSRLGDIVFDPFMGSGTVGSVAERLGRRWVGTDLNPAYHQLAKKRTAQRGLRFSEIGV